MAPNPGRLPLWLKILFALFLAVMVPVYAMNYGPTNFLYFCDISLFLTLVSMWTERSLPASMALTGIFVGQVLWCLDFFTELAGFHLVGMTSYMFDPRNPLFLRSLSFFHCWLPFLLLYMVKKLGYDRRALWSWTAVAWTLCLVAYFFFPPAGAVLADSKIPRNINYVFGFDDAAPQTWMPAPLYLVVWMLALFLIGFLPAHLIFKKGFRRPDPA